MTHFCTCQNTACRCHPSNHSQGCDLCIQKELRKGEIPSCFFNLVIRPGRQWRIVPWRPSPDGCWSGRRRWPPLINSS